MKRKSSTYICNILPAITIIMLLISSHLYAGRNIYFSTSIGNDTRTIAQAQNPATPWKTTNKLNTVFPSLLPGDSILFKRGEVFFGSIVVTNSGTASLPIVIGSYGSGSKPIISGFSTLSSWTNEGGGIYSTTVTCESKPDLVTVNGVQYGMGRFPNFGTDLLVDSHVTNISISDADLNSSYTNWSGAEAVIIKNDYTMDRCLINSHTNQTLTYTSLGSTSNATNGYFYFIQNDIRTLDQFGEWYYNGTKLYMYFGTTTPSNYIVKVPTVNKLLYDSWYNYITISNLVFEGANVTGIEFEGTSSYNTIKNCEVNFSGRAGIILVGSHGLIDNSIVNNVNESGITVNGSFMTITNNIIKKCGIIPGATPWGSSAIGIVAIGSNVLIQYNVVDSIGYHGIYLASTNTLIKNNFVTNFLYNLNDGGGIYVAGEAAPGRVIDGNIVLYGIGKLGLPVGNHMAEGIFLDQFSTNVEVNNNSVAHCGYSGIKLHRANTAEIKNNTCFNNIAGIRLQESNYTALIYNLNIKGNILVANANQYTLMWSRYSTNLFGSADSNYFVRPIDDTYSIRTTDLYVGDTDRSLSNWKQYSGLDLHSNSSPISITNPNDIRFEYNATKVNKNVVLSGTYMDVKGILYFNNINLAPYTSAVLIKSASNNNLPPVIQNQVFQTSVTSSNGTTVGNVIATDPDAGQSISFSIISGNTNSAFAINNSTGTITVINSSALVLQTNSTFSLTVKVQDNGVGNLSSEAIITINIVAPGNCSAIGNISYQLWSGIPGTAVTNLTSSINFPNNPTSTAVLTSMEAPTNNTQSYGTRIAGYICAPSTGSYTFWIASDDNAELWLSTDNQQANKQIIAFHTSWTSSREWNKFSTQKSASINLVQGQSYYIEALMKQDNGPANLAVGWLKPGQSGSVPSEVIPGSVLSPLGTPQTVLVTSVSLPSTSLLTIGSSITLPATVLPANATNTTLNWTSSNTSVATVNNSGLVTGILSGNAIITATSTDGSNKSGTCLITVSQPACSAVGNITYQTWNNITGTAVSNLTSSINYPNNPSTTAVLTSMEGPTNYSESYGARIAGYICAPSTGSYTFWIASDDNAELWLSTDNQQANKQIIAFHTSWTSSREWNKFSTQKSAQIYLVQGQSYYIEALMKQDNGPANLAVGWLKPGQSGSVPSEVIPGSVLSPLGTSQTVLVTSVSLPSTSSLFIGSSITLPATVLPANATNTTLNWTSSNTSVATVNSSGLVTGILSGNAIITATSTDGSNKSGTCLITVSQPACSAVGNITYQTWNNITGTAVSNLTSSINYPNNPTSTAVLTSMEGPTNYSESYGARIAGYICAPSTGSYTFWIASDDNAELWLSTDNQQANKQIIAFHTSWTSSREWNKFTTQKSASINLVQGQSYYIEALMKQGIGPANIAVGWLKPGQSGSVPSEVIPGSILSPLNENKSIDYKIENDPLSESEIELSVFPNPLVGDELSIKVENLQSEATLKIFTISGVECYEADFNNSELIKINRTVFKSGIYLIKVFNNQFIKTTKLVVR